MKTTNQTKTKGRPKGQKSYAAVSPVELARLVKANKLNSLPISKKFLRSLGVDDTKFPDAEPPTIKSQGGKRGRPKAEPKAEKTPKKTAKAKKVASPKEEETEIKMKVTA